MGGMHGFGRIEAEPEEPVFHADWEARVYALQRAMGATGLWTIDGGRASLENLPPLDYLAASYYERWFLGLERRVVAHGLVGEDEIAAGRALQPGIWLNRKMTAEDAKAVSYPHYDRPAQGPARFKVGDQVRTKNMHPKTHTRLPRYARDKCGIIEAVRGCHVFPDTAALGAGEKPQWLYTVVFTGKELWGEDADPSTKVSIEAFEPYLLPA
ncbi:MAG: nitrile hydratase subunit beta [Alphaproteobacteria bacterium]|nr:nitrile hydratase subunit beta [Alphaproteobacteria bacterium]